MEDFDPPAGAIVGATVVLFNGPPHSGKDTAANYLAEITPRARKMKFAHTLKRSTHMDFGLPYELPEDAFEHCKDTPSQAFFGMTPREAYIQKSEKRQKPFLGNDIYGRVFLRRLWRAYQQGIRVAYVSDSGFASEAVPVIEAVGEKNCLLVRIHAEQRGCTFTGDSRSYITVPGVATVDIPNNDDIETFHALVARTVLPFIENRAVFSNSSHYDTRPYLEP